MASRLLPPLPGISIHRELWNRWKGFDRVTGGFQGYLRFFQDGTALPQGTILHRLIEKLEHREEPRQAKWNSVHVLTLRWL